MPYFFKECSRTAEHPFLGHWSPKMDTYTVQDQCDARPTVTFSAAQHCHCSWPVLISHPAEGRKLSWPGWLVA